METNEVNDDDFDTEPEGYEPTEEQLENDRLAGLDYRAEMIEAGYGDPEEWDWADINATREIDELRGK